MVAGIKLRVSDVAGWRLLESTYLRSRHGSFIYRAIVFLVFPVKGIAQRKKRPYGISLFPAISRDPIGFPSAIAVRISFSNSSSLLIIGPSFVWSFRPRFVYSRLSTDLPMPSNALRSLNSASLPITALRPAVVVIFRHWAKPVIIGRGHAT